ncbi:MAG: hypothetical protein ABIO46_08250 [Chitinophagales bacterium]
MNRSKLHIFLIIKKFTPEQRWKSSVMSPKITGFIFGFIIFASYYTSCSELSDTPALKLQKILTYPILVQPVRECRQGLGGASLT